MNKEDYGDLFDQMFGSKPKDNKPQWVKDIEDMNKKLQAIGNKKEKNV